VPKSIKIELDLTKLLQKQNGAVFLHMVHTDVSGTSPRCFPAGKI